MAMCGSWFDHVLLTSMQDLFCNVCSIDIQAEIQILKGRLNLLFSFSKFFSAFKYNSKNPQVSQPLCKAHSTTLTRKLCRSTLRDDCVWRFLRYSSHKTSCEAEHRRTDKRLRFKLQHHSNLSKHYTAKIASPDCFPASLRTPTTSPDQQTHT